jgi:hypothetical protein
MHEPQQQFLEGASPRFCGSFKLWEGIHGHTHLQKKYQIPREILDRHRRIPWLTE